MLDNITLTWLTNTAISSARLYRENKLPFFAPMGVKIPVAVSAFPDELYQAPRSWVERAYPKLIHYNKAREGRPLRRLGTAEAPVRGGARRLAIASPVAWSMQVVGLKAAYECVAAFSATDFTDDLGTFDIPTLVMHGEDDQIVPIATSAKRSARLIKGAQERYYPGLPHGLMATHADQVTRDLRAFIRS